MAVLVATAKFGAVRIKRTVVIIAERIALTYMEKIDPKNALYIFRYSHVSKVCCVVLIMLKPCDMKIIDRKETKNICQVCNLFIYYAHYNLFILLFTLHHVFADVYDSEWWRECMGPVTSRLERLGFLLCVDAIPAFNNNQKGSVSLNIAELICLSQGPHLRYNPDNMLAWLLIPDDMAADVQLKFFDYVIKKEINPLSVAGVAGPDGPVKCKLFGASLDLKGREKLNNQVSVQAYCGCSYCKVHFDRGPSCAIYSVARRWLAPDDPLREEECEIDGQKYFFRSREERAVPGIKTTQSVFTNSTIARARSLTHYLGQKGRPLLSSMTGFNYEKLNLLEWMHNLARAFDNFLEILVGTVDGSSDRRARKTSQGLGLFKEIWPSQVQYLSAARTRLLARMTDETIKRADSAWCRRWLRICTVAPEPGARVARLRDRVEDLRDMAARGERIPLANVVGALPWRLTPGAVDVVNRRVANIIYPHYTPTCGLGDETFIKRTGCWRTASKLVALLAVLVPVTRGYVPQFRAGLRKLIHGLKILEGQVYSVDEARELNLDPGSKSLKKSDIKRANKLIIKGLAMIEGSCAVCSLKPALHCLCHYALGTKAHGILRWLWMMAFERFNKKCKNLTSNKKLPFESLANSLVRDSTACYHRWYFGRVVNSGIPGTASVCYY